MHPEAPLYSVDGAAPPQNGRAFYLRGADGVRLRGAFWPGKGRGLALILNGRTEFIEKYYGVIERFQQQGFDVASLDWRGQGLSDRALKNPRKGYVADFADYQADLDLLLGGLEPLGASLSSEAPWVMFAHSMGGAIGARALLRRAAPPAPNASPPPGEFSAAIFSAPMFKLYGGWARQTAMRLACWASIRAGRSRAFVAGMGAQTLAEAGFEDNPLTSDAEQFAIYARFLSEHPELALGGATWGWLCAALDEMKQLKATAVPALGVLGRDDEVIDNAAAQSFIAATPKGRCAVIPDARHEPYLETPSRRAAMWSEVDAFLRDLQL